ncbi:hypothetical protein NM688_g7855 [Phlebia brevispora]|uniref:Uncharacterized protein n=1 Tax=Phlebia brevispora TaxID=194682 RepID=A0ACC1S0C8_9APHY|nr:hypothetical protein NM688_g7855 [Phlebia brevispora]
MSPAPPTYPSTPMAASANELEQTICIIGSGAAGLITAHTLIRDGFKNVDVISRDRSAGGVWAAERVYPGLVINNVHGEFRFSPLPMPPPRDWRTTGGRLTGEDMQYYMESFEEHFLKGRIRYNTEVLKIKRISERNAKASPPTTSSRWAVSVQDKISGVSSQLKYDKVVLCSGGCHVPHIPPALTPETAEMQQFRGPVVHSSELGSRADAILDAVKPSTEDRDCGTVLIVGGGKSAQDAAVFFATRNRKVSVVFDTADAFLAAPMPLPAFIRKSRFLAVISPHVELKTSLERFLHTTTAGSYLVHGLWNFLTWSSFVSLSIPADSPLHNTHSLFWGLRTNDEGVSRSDGFHTLVNSGKIELIAPARANTFGTDGRSIILTDGRLVEADAVILATGFSSSWNKIFDPETMEQLGMNRHPPPAGGLNDADMWKYASLERPQGAPKSDSQSDWAASIYRGIVPAANILNRDFAINGALFTTNNGYTFEVIAHWISSYFRNDPFLHLPSSPEEATQLADQHTAWLRRRYPGMLGWINESIAGDLAFWNWPQAVDTLLEDMELKSMRSGGNWLTWPFKVIDLQEIQFLKEERDAKRIEYFRNMATLPNSKGQNGLQ